MQVEFEKTSSISAKLSVTLESAAVDAEFKKFFKNVAKEARIPGFRPGKAPRRILQARYGDLAQQEVAEKLINGSLPNAMIENDVLPVSRPKIDYDGLKEGENFSYTVEVETRPEIELKQYEGLDIETIEPTVDEDALHKELERLQEEAVQLVPVSDRDVVETGDLVVMNFVGTQGGVPVDGAKGEGTMYEIGGDDYLPGLSAALIGAKTPSSRSVAIDFPDDHSMEKWRGMKTTFAIELLEIKKKELPTIDDDFAQDVGEEDLAALKKKINDKLQTEAEADAQRQQRDSALKALINANPFEVPPSMITDQVDRMISNAVQRVQEMMGGNFPLDGLDIEGLREKNREEAEHIVRSGLLLVEVTKATDISVTDEEVDAEIERLVKGSGEQARNHYNRAEAKTNLRYRLVEERTINWLLKSAGIEVEDTGKSEETSASEEEEGG